MRRFVAVALAASAATASADPPIASSEQPRRREPGEPEPAPVPQAPEPVARDTSRAPPPGQESGRIDPGEPGDSVGRKIARGALVVPKYLFMIVSWPVGEGIYLDDRYKLTDWYYRIFYWRNRTISIVPTATYETGYGLTIGAQFRDIDTFGHHERLALQATAGVTYRVGLLASIDTGDRLGPVRLEGSGNFDRRPAEPFYGIGNQGNFFENPLPQQVNPLIDSTAIATHFRYQEARAAALADVSLGHDFHFAARGAVAELKYSPSSTDPSIEDAYEPDAVIGFGTTTKHIYGELEVRYDDRRRSSPWEPLSLRSSGTLAVAFAGYSHRLDELTGFWHYGGELQHYFRLGYGPRLLVARLRTEAVSGSLSQVPITELPMLGGGSLLRGYSYGRFRDRITALGSLQYMWALFAFGSAFVFADVGRVYNSWDSFTLDGLHMGYGVGLELYSVDTFLIDFSVASSTDGGIAVLAEFSPMLDFRPRWR
jgi:hypothetical protein